MIHMYRTPRTPVIEKVLSYHVQNLREAHCMRVCRWSSDRVSKWEHNRSSDLIYELIDFRFIIQLGALRVFEDYMSF